MTTQYPHGMKAQAQRGGTLLGLFLGLVIGVLIAFGVVWYLNKAPLPFLDRLPNTEKVESKPGTPQATPQTLPGKPGDKVSEKPRFEFYKILPGGQEAAPAPADANAKQPASNAPAAAAKPDAPAAVSESIYLQVGSFQKSTDADNLKAKLALMGLEAGVQEVQVPDKGLMHRVRVGPFAKPEEMNRIRNQLSQNGIQTSVVKTKEAASAAQ